MKLLLGVLALLLSAGQLHAQGIAVQKVHGDVSVRHGVTEQWTVVAAGDVLRPDDTMRTGPDGSAVVVASQNGAAKRITLPSEVIVDIADIRDLSAEELMLKLAMEKVRASSYQSKDELEVPNAAVVHGANKANSSSLQGSTGGSGMLEWNGARVLFNNGFYSTCALKGMELCRLFPLTATSFGNRFMVAQSLERANLRGEALSEYTSMLGMSGLSASQQATVKQKIAALEQR